jgi:hypothetical protein
MIINKPSLKYCPFCAKTNKAEARVIQDSNRTKKLRDEHKNDHAAVGFYVPKIYKSSISDAEQLALNSKVDALQSIQLAPPRSIKPGDSDFEAIAATITHPKHIRKGSLHDSNYIDAEQQRSPVARRRESVNEL